jgi:hypothetical protein
MRIEKKYSRESFTLNLIRKTNYYNFKNHIMKKALLFVLTVLSANVYAQLQTLPTSQATATLWQINKANGPINLAGTGVDLQNQHGNPVAYQLASIPAKDNPGWGPAPMKNGQIHFSEYSSIPCFSMVDFTYFRSYVYIPTGKNHDLRVKIGSVDDGVRMYIFNSRYPQLTNKTGNIGGFYVAASDGKLYGSNIEVNFTNYVVPGELNLIMIVQFDDCQVGNNLTGGIEIKYNGQVVIPNAGTQIPGGNTYSGNQGDYIIGNDKQLLFSENGKYSLKRRFLKQNWFKFMIFSKVKNQIQLRTF